MDDIDRLVAAMFAAAMCAGKSVAHGDYFQAYDYFMSMTKDREEHVRTQAPADPRRRPPFNSQQR
jgi:hypothetical protein